MLIAGSCGGVGLAGLTLGGGYGLFAREFGLTCDHLVAVRMVDGNGEVRDSRDEPELLWACVCRLLPPPFFAWVRADLCWAA